MDAQNPSGRNFWPTMPPIHTTVDLGIWIEAVCQYMMPILIETQIPLQIPIANRSGFKRLDPVDPSSIQSILSRHVLPSLDATTRASLETYQSCIQAYFQNRNTDGWLNTFTFDNTAFEKHPSNPNVSNLIRVKTVSEIGEMTQDLNSLPDPDKWTPLEINGTTKSYMTPEWGTVNSGILNGDVQNAIQNEAQLLFPTADQWKQEIKNIKTAQENLNDEQKMIAEYWLQSGGERVNDVSGTAGTLYGTVSPCGVWLAFADIYLRSNSRPIEDEIRYYMTISAGLFETSLLTWKIKRANLQARPIQKIRQLLYNTTTNINTLIHQDWNPRTPGTSTTSGAYWIPYQTLNSVTPPFPDFCAGHSAFGGVAAKLMNYLTGTDMVVLQNPVTSSPIFKYTCQLFYNNNGWINASINNIFLYPRCSAIQPASVPLSGIRLNWPTWSQMANSNSQSRIYCGVHWDSSNQAGLLVGNQIADALWNVLHL
jgi:hypothetical protein